MAISIPSTRKYGFRMNVVGAFGALIILFWVAIAIFAPHITPYPVGKIIDFNNFAPMSSKDLLGTDYLGRDMLSRIIMGARYTVGISAAGVTLACTIGVTLGMIAAVVGGIFDTVLSRFMDALLSMPSLLFGLVVVAGVGSSIKVLILTLAVIYAPGSFRFARSLAVNFNAMDFVTVARARGEGILYLISEEIFPNIIGPVFADFGLRFVFIVLLLSGLSFLGLGVQPPQADWGALVRQNLGGLSYGAPAVVFPSIAIASLTIAVNMVIDNLPQRIRDRIEQ